MQIAHGEAPLWAMGGGQNAVDCLRPAFQIEEIFLTGIHPDGSGFDKSGDVFLASTRFSRKTQNRRKFGLKGEWTMKQNQRVSDTRLRTCPPASVAVSLLVVLAILGSGVYVIVFYVR